MAEKGNKKTEYLRQCFSAVHTNQTLALDCFLEPTMEGDETPALMLHGKFSRFVVALIDNSGITRKIMKANIRAEEVPYILRQYELTLAEKFRTKLHPDEDEEEPKQSAAYTTRFRLGNLKGKTPAEILLADPLAKGQLERQRQFLQDNVGKYPSNQELIDAIDDAIYLMDNGLLTDEQPHSKNFITLYQEDYKYMANGSSDTKTLAKIAITCDFSLDSPWGISIENGECPTVNGKPDRTQVRDKRSGTMQINDTEMARFMHALQNIKQLFESYVFPDAYRFVDTHSWRPGQ